MAGFRNYTLTLNIGQEITLSVPDSNFVSCIESSGLFVVSPNSQTPVQMQKGIAIGFDYKFDSLQITNTTNAIQQVQLYIGSGEIRDNRLVASGGFSIVGSAVASISVHAVTSAASEIKPQNGSRVQVMLVNTGNAICYLGFSAGVTIANGLPLGVGSSINLTCQTAVWAVSGATATELRVLEEGVA